MVEGAPVGGVGQYDRSTPSLSMFPIGALARAALAQILRERQEREGGP